MTYLIGQIVWFLLLTAVIWTAVGWFLQRTTHQRKLRALTEEYERREQGLLRIRDELRRQLDQGCRQQDQKRPDAPDPAPNQTIETQSARRLVALESELKTVKAHLKQARDRLDATRIVAQTREQKYDDLRARLDATKRTLAVVRNQIPATPPTPQVDLPIETGADTPSEVDTLLAAVRQRDVEIKTLREQIKLRATPPAPDTGMTGQLFETPPASLLSSPQGTPDDLKQISGIGPVLEARLNDIGVFHFHQIANFIEQDVGWVASKINAFPNRIMRDNWVAQARKLMQTD